MDSLKKQRASVKGKFTRLQNYVTSTEAEQASRGALQVRLASLEESWKEYNRIHKEMLELGDAAAIQLQEEDYEEVESRYYDLMAYFTDSMNESQTTWHPSSRAPTSDIKLPRITLPTFSGNALEWTSFYDLFSSLIHKNITLSDSQKLHYLKGAITGEAASLLQAIEITDANYIEAWSLLIDRYQNERQLIHCHLQNLFGQKAVSADSATSLRHLLDTTAKHVRALHALNLPTDQWDHILVFLITERLDSDARRQWELSSPGKSFPKFTELKNFVEQRCRALEATSAKPKPKQANNYFRPQMQPHTKTATSSFVTGTANQNINCVFCKGQHLIYKCQNFAQLSVTCKTGVARQHNLCFNCLRPGHSSKQCSSGSCRKCGRKHHTLLHVDKCTNQTMPQGEIVDVSSNTVTDQPVIMNHHSNQPVSMQSVLVSTAVVRVTDGFGGQQNCRVLLDSGSQASFITEACIQRLGLCRVQASIPIVGICQSGSGYSNGMVELQIQSNLSDFSLRLNALILRKITGHLPSNYIDVNHWDHITNLSLADPGFNTPGPVDILLGADVYYEIVTGGKISGISECPTAVNTRFGWIISGKAGEAKDKPNQITVHLIDICIQDQLKRFWELEEVGSISHWTTEEKKCDDLYLSTYSRDDTGRFTVKLPLKEDGGSLGSSKEMALKRLVQIERRLARFPDLRDQYNQFMDQYVQLGHMQIIPECERDESLTQTNYLPHHFVIKESSSTTALRVVFDASAKTSSGISFNDKLMIGPQLQADIWSILLRFRMNKYAFTADVEKMYRQVNVTRNDANLQRILWRNSPSQDIQEYRLTTLTYGTASAPYLATKTLQQLAIEEGQEFPLAKTVTLRDFYMDDLMSGANHITDGLRLQAELIQMMKRGGFTLRKWASNEPAFLESLPVDLRELQLPLKFDSDDTIKALGLNWHPAGDYFFFKVTISNDNGSVNKRRILSDVSRIFDPLGMLAPIVIVAKIILQKLWISGVNWDDKLPANLETEWLRFQEELPGLEEIKIPRYVTNNNSLYQLHGFCDASEHAYGAAVYIRSEKSNGDTSIFLLCSKTRVAPIKQVSLPRLELCGAVLLSRLLNKVQASLHMKFQAVYAWTDSTITLHWISGFPKRWKTFVANRVAEIQGLVPPENWHHISTKENPADVASRGLRPQELTHDALWWNGPSWLALDPASWPSSSSVINYQQCELEERTVISLVVETDVDLQVIHRFSSLFRLKRVVAYCLRFIHNTRQTADNRIFGSLTSNELDRGLTLCISLVQKTVFNEIRSSLMKGNPVPNHIKSLNPFLDKNGIIRVGGRLKHSKLSYDRRFPVLLPKKHHLSELIIKDVHGNQLHAGPQLTLATLQQKYWIINGRSAVRHILHQCHKCFRDRATVSTQQMGDLPFHRVEPARPFLRCGVDYGGPLFIKPKGGRGGHTTKAYIALFVCLCTKAVHLELVSDLTTEAFIAALRRFMARRGMSVEIYSDNGSNFVGAASELRELRQQVRNQNHNETVANFLAAKGVKWHFIPPKAPHFGGLWEAGMKSVKTHLRRIVGGTALTFEELSTVLTQIEACLNSRPLIPASSDPNDLAVLTPGHFLIGDALTSIPDPDVTELKLNTLSRWQLVQRLTQHFWKRWQMEYLSKLQQRPKWLNPNRNLKIGDLVLIKEDNTPPLKWIKGRVLEVHPGSDSIVRVVTLRTQNGQYKRPITKLCLLPSYDNQ